MSIDALFAGKLRTFLTALGIVIGTAIVIVMLSVGQGVKSLILVELTSITPETLYVEIRVPSTGTAAQKDQNTAGALGAGVQVTTLTLDDVEEILDHPNIENGYGMTIHQEKMTAAANEKTVMIFAVESAYEDVESLRLAEGRFYSDQDDRSLKKVIVLGSEVKKILFGESNAIGEKVKIGNLSFEVVGVAEEIGTQFFLNMDETVYMPIRTAQKQLIGVDYIQAISLKMFNKELIGKTINDIEKMLRQNHDIKDPEDDDFVVRTMEESMEIVDTVTGGISILLFAIAAISLVVGGVGIMNVMYVAVTERTSEIGLKKAIGARPFAIKFQFMAESIVISIIGGSIGVALGVGISWLVSFVAGKFEFEWPLVITLDMLVFAFVISAGLGIVFGYAPANKASKLNPIDALRKG